MSTELRLRQDTAANIATVTPAEGEPGYDTTNKRLRIGDGATQGAFPVANIADVQNQAGVFLTVAGTGSPIDYDTLTGSTGAANDGVNITAYATGQKFGFFAAGDNTGAVTIDIDSVGAKAVEKNGAALASGDLVEDRYYEIVYDGTALQLITSGSTAEILHVRDEKTSGTDGGSSATQTDNTRTLNTVVTNEIAGASLSSNQVTLPAGTYEIEASAPANQSNRHRLFLYDTTGAAVLLLGSSAFCPSGTGVATHTFVVGRFTLAVESVLELRHYTNSARATDGLGLRTSDGRTEVYAQAIFRKVS